MAFRGMLLKYNVPSFILMVRFTIKNDNVIHYLYVSRNKKPTYWQIKREIAI